MTITHAQDIADVVMREQDFAKFLDVLNQHAKGFEEQVGRPVGGRSATAQQPATSQSVHSTPDPQFDGAAMTIRPRES